METTIETPRRETRRSHKPEQAEPPKAPDPVAETAEKLAALATKRVAPSGLGNPLMRPLLIFALLGAVSEIFVRVPHMSAVGLLGAVAATVAYPAWGCWKGWHTIPSLRERLADNSYYLGFIITQISLLIGFGAPALMDVEIKAVDVLRFFGIAIGASMAGLIARTLIMQGGHSIKENEEIVQSEVESLSREVSTLAGTVAADSRKIAKELDDTLAAFKDSHTNIEKQLKDWTDSVTRSMADYQKLANNQVAAAQRGVDATDSATKTLQTTASSGTVSLNDAIGRFSTAIENMKTSVNTRIEAATTEVVATTQTLDKATKTAATAQTVTSKSLGEIATDIQQAADHIKQLKTFEAKLKGLGNDIDQSVSSSTQTVAETRKNAETFKKELDDSVNAFKKLLEDFRKELSTTGG